MTDAERDVLEQVAAGCFAFHTGVRGYHWRGLDGTRTGAVSCANILERLERNGFIATESHLWLREHRVVLTPAGVAAIASMPAVA